MASIVINSTTKAIHRKGYNVSVFMVADDGRERSKTFYKNSDTEPTQESLQPKLDRFLEDHNTPGLGPEKVYTESDINKILKEKKHFKDGDKFPDDLKDKETLEVI